jgi:hypothetical protein
MSMTNAQIYEAGRKLIVEQAYTYAEHCRLMHKPIPQNLLSLLQIEGEGTPAPADTGLYLGLPGGSFQGSLRPAVEL